MFPAVAIGQPLQCTLVNKNTNKHVSVTETVLGEGGSSSKTVFCFFISAVSQLLREALLHVATLK